jgi:hypothetical protein
LRALALLLVGSVGFDVVAQRPSTRATGTSNNMLTGSQGQVSFDLLFHAVMKQDYSAEQIRRFIDDQNNVVSVRESLEVAADGTQAPPFSINYVGVVGALPGSPADLEWRQTYLRFGRLFHEQGSFRVRDLDAVIANYSLHDFGGVVRAGRTAKRLVVFPQVLDKSIWVVDVDEVTCVPLYWAEFDANFRLLSEVETVSFWPAIQGGGPQANSDRVKHKDVDDALATMGDPPGVVRPENLTTAEYELGSIQTEQDYLTGRPKLIFEFTDGVDQFYVVQAASTDDPLETLFPPGSDRGNTIARYRDPGMSVLLFWEGDVTFHVAGRGSLQRLDEFAREIYLQALAD